MQKLQHSKVPQLSEQRMCHEMVYADDTLLVDIAGPALDAYAKCVAECGREYGLELNWSKTESLNVNAAGQVVHDANGQPIESKLHLKYLGIMLSSDGRLESEVAVKIGNAAQDFKVLARIWSHARVSKQFRYIVYQACVVQKLLYGLEGAWLNKALLRKIDGFHARCVRKLLGIAPSFYSRVSNVYVLKACASRPLSKMLLERQLVYFAHVARMPDDSPIRGCIFEPSSVKLVSHMHKKRHGRPMNQWAPLLHKVATEMCGGQDLMQAASQAKSWKALAKKFCS